MAVLTEIRGSRRWAAITPSDTTLLTEVPRAIYVGVTGDVTAVDDTGTATLFKAMPVGLYPIQPVRINSTATTATNILALY